MVYYSAYCEENYKKTEMNKSVAYENYLII